MGLSFLEIKLNIKPIIGHCHICGVCTNLRFINSHGLCVGCYKEEIKRK